MYEINKIINRDCISFSKEKLLKESIDLIIADPPYFKMVKDKWDNQWKTEEEFYNWCEQWISECYRVLKSTGSLYIYGGSPFIFEICNIARKINLQFNNAIVWYFGTGMGGTKKYRIEHENLLFFTKSNKYTYNADAIRVPYESEKAGGGRTHNPLGKTCGTVWRFSRVQRNAKEFTGHSTQKPLELSDRVIKASSNEGDLIYIPFGGSGSEIESCIRNNRNYIATETNNTYIEDIIKPRLKQII
jgi:DNA modification methylase